MNCRRLASFRLLAALVLGAGLFPGASGAQTRTETAGSRCGEAVAIQTREASTTRYSFVAAAPHPAVTEPITLMLFPGGSGHVDLDELGCPRALTGNSLVRSIAAFAALGFNTALVDAPSDYQGGDGLAGFRASPLHANDIGVLVASLRARTKGAVWVVGTSRGSISAANAAARLSGSAAPDGVVVTSALMVGDSAAKKPWVAQTIFDIPLENIRMPALVVGHAADKCTRSPPEMMNRVAARLSSGRKQVVTVGGGPGYPGSAGLQACEGKAPHGFTEQEAEVAAGIARFVRGNAYEAK